MSASGPHQMTYLEWGAPTSERTAVCVHGLTGNARDFEELAQTLAEAGWRVVCPDVVGRGESDWLDDPADYALRQYVTDMTRLLTGLGTNRVDWVGTSMGGLIGMAMASHDDTPVRRLVLNDIGPFVPTAALARLEATLGTDPRFPDLFAAERWLRKERAPYGPLSDAEWRRMTERATRVEGREYRLHYDPAIALAFARSSGRHLDLWSLWDRIECPVLVVRGEESDLLLRETADEMRTRGPRAEVVELPGCGHAPALMAEEQISLVLNWLRATDA